VAASLGDAEAAFLLAEADLEAGRISIPVYWAAVAAAAKTSRSAARALSEARESACSLALFGAPVDRGG
jgi:hypothetical protein